MIKLIKLVIGGGEAILSSTATLICTGTFFEYFLKKTEHKGLCTLGSFFVKNCFYEKNCLHCCMWKRQISVKNDIFDQNCIKCLEAIK